MGFLDIRTVLFGYIITDIVSTLVMVLLWYQNRNRFKGTLFWVANYTFNTAGIFLIILRGYVPDWLSIPFSNTLIITGVVLGYIGLQRFLEKEGTQLHNYFLIIVFYIVHYYFSFIQPDLFFRAINLSMALAVVFFQYTWLLLFKVDRNLRSLTSGVGIVFALYCIINVARIIELLNGEYIGNDYFHSGSFSSLLLLSHQLLFILLTYFLSLMFNKRLLMDIGTQEEKFSKAFHSSSYAIILIRISDGKIIEVNDGFCKQTGFRNDEVIGKTTLELDLWVREENRTGGIEEVKRIGQIHDREYLFKIKSGEIITGLVYAEIIRINNEDCILATITDITERKKAENKIRDLLAEKDIILKEVHHRVKNNMSIIFSLLVLEAEKNNQSEVKSILLDSAGRVQSMMVLYDKLYRSDIKKTIPVRDYFSSLIKEIAAIFSHKMNVKIKTDIDDFILNTNLLSPLGIIINELITNSMKYAFAEQRSGNIYIKIIKDINRIKISFEDDGNGIPENVTFESSSGFGLQLVSILVKQLKGSIKIERERGTRFLIEFEE